MVKVSKKKTQHWKKGKLGQRQMDLDEFHQKKPKKKYSQDWRAYNLSQTNEFVMFQDILVELIDKVVDVRNPLYKKGRPFASFKDMIFCCVMRAYFDKSSRRSTSYLSLAKGKDYITNVPHFNSILNYYKNTQLSSVLKHLIEQSGKPLRDLEKDFTVDSSGFATSLYGHWMNVRTGKNAKRRLFRKAHVCSGTRTNIISSVEVTGGFYNDSPYFKDLIKATKKNFDIREVSADAGYTSRANMQAVSDMGAIPYIMFKSNNTEKARGSLIWSRMFQYFTEHKEDFLEHYHKRSNAESVFNMIKRKLGTHLRCKSDVAMTNELLCKCLSHNICVLIAEIFEFQAVLDYEESEPIIVRM
jgi:transposase